LQGIESASVSLVLVDNATIRRINRTHLQHDWPTDVITFPLSEPGDLPLCAELVLSAEMATETALAAGTQADAELALYLVHGLLHLCGLDDQTEAERAMMRSEERRVLSALGLPCLFDLVAAVEGEPEPSSAREQEVTPCSE
jgi:probable rRNA maturation factor